MFVHSKSVIHRDVKPENLLLSGDFSIIKLADFGTSVQLIDGQTLTSGKIGTSNYLSPEILDGSKYLCFISCMNWIELGREYDYRCDVWALGCVLYELIERQRAFDGSSEIGIYHKISCVSSLFKKLYLYFRANMRLRRYKVLFSHLLKHFSTHHFMEE